ncbi:hypothetical protein T4D_1540, partial [Trichinella pseudospiralis]
MSSSALFAISSMFEYVFARSKPVFGSKSLPQFRRISRRSWEGFVSPARAEFISALKRSSSDSPYRSRRRRFNV